MKKSIVISTVILASLVAIATPTHKTHADSVNGNTVVKVEGHNYYLDNDQIASRDGDKLYIDGQEVILTPDAPDVTPPETPTQAEPQQQVTPETPIQAVPTPIQEVPTPQPTAEPQAPVQGVPTPKQETPEPIYQTPQAPETPQAPTKTPDQPLQQVENVPVKTYPQDNTPLPTQTPQTFPATTIKDTEKVEPIKLPTETAPIETSEQVSEPKHDTKTVEQLKTVASIAPQATDKPSASVKAPSQPITPKATQTLTQAPKLATATLPTTGTDDTLSNIVTIVGAVLMLLATVAGFISRKDNKNTKEFK